MKNAFSFPPFVSGAVCGPDSKCNLFLGTKASLLVLGSFFLAAPFVAGQEMMESASRWIEKTDFIGGQWTNVYIRADTGDALPVTELRSQEVTNSAAFSQDIVQSATAPRNPRIVTAPVIRIAGNAVLAEGSEYTVRFASNARTVGAIELRRNGSPPLRSSVLGLAYYEGERSVMIADLKPSAAQVLEGGRVFYSDAFDGDFGMVADIVYTCAARSFEQDVVIRTKLPSPTLYGMSKNASLCVITEFYDTPKPAAREQVLDLSEWNSWLGNRRGTDGR